MSVLPTDLPPGIELTHIGDLPVLQIRTQACTASVALQGAQVVRWKPAGCEDVLFVSERAAFTTGKAIRGGIPLCGPWFGSGRSGHATPTHGWFRSVPWRLTAAQVRPDGTAQLALALEAADLVEVAPSWPTDAHLNLDVTAGHELTLVLTTTAGAEPLPVEHALHSYFAVGDVRQVTVSGVQGAPYVDKVDGFSAKVADGPVRFTGETDRVFTSAATTVIDDPVIGRRTTITKSGSASTVTWNPWDEKARALADLGADQWQGMVCVETANVMADAITVPAGGRHQLSATIRVS